MSRPANLDECIGPLWKPKLWEEINKDKYLKYTNCYSYAFNYVDYGNKKRQPGEIHGTKYRDNTCEEIISKVKNDYIDYNIVECTFDEKLPNDRYKIALVVDLDERDKGTDDFDQDYHFYRQDCHGTWSHKTGTGDVTNQDASGNAITNPKHADREYVSKCNREGEGDEDCNEEHNYKDFCGYLSVPLNSTFGPVIRYNRIISKDNNNNKIIIK